MTTTFLNGKSPLEMLRKTEREYERHLAEPHAEHSDHIVNFFISANHLYDYIKHNTPQHQADAEHLRKNITMAVCRDIADKAKHVVLTKRTDPSTFSYDGSIGGAPINGLPINGNGQWVIFYQDGRHFEIDLVANDVMNLWRDFFRNHGIQ